MTHINVDRLLKYALDIYSDDTERANIESHLEACFMCGQELERIRSDIRLLGSVRPEVHISGVPERGQRQTVVLSIIRAAALIIFGILIGFGASNWLHSVPAPVTPSYFKPSPPEDLPIGVTVSDATEISSSYFQRILEEVD